MNKEETAQQVQKKKPNQKKEEDLSEEDQQLKEQIEHAVEKIRDSAVDDEERLRYITKLFEQVRTVKKSRVNIPKEIKFLKPLYKDLVASFEAEANSPFKKAFADFLSYTSMILAENYDADSLLYLKQGTNTINLKNMGNEYIVNLAGDLAIDYDKRYSQDKNDSFEDILTLTAKILPLLCESGNEISAVDLLVEIERIELIQPFTTTANYLRIFNYLLAYVEYCADNVEFESVLNNLYKLATKFDDSYNALRVALRLNDRKKIEETYNNCKNEGIKKQLCFSLARHRTYLEGEENEENMRIMSNSMLSEYFIILCKDLDVLNPKKPKEIYKGMIEDKSDKIDSAQLNLGDSFVNGFVNIGTCKEALLEVENEKPWIQRVKDSGIMSTVASLGLVYMWNFEEFSSKISDYFDLKDGYAKAGACIALGLSSSGVWDESDPAKALLEDTLSSDEECMKIGSIIGLGLAYAATSRTDLKETLEGYINDENAAIEISTTAALSLSLIFVGDADEDVINSILTSLLTFPKEKLDNKFARWFAVSLALNFMGKQEKCETVIEALESVEHPLGKICAQYVEICAYIGSGNVLKIQEYMEKAIKASEDEQEILSQTIGLIGIALIAVSDVVGTKMVIRNIHHILQYCNSALKRAVPIMLTVVGVKDFNIQITDLLYKLAHDEDKETALRALLGLGIIAAGTNNSRVGGLLRSLAQYYETDDEYLFVIKVALGILHAGKGLVGINPYYSEDFIYSKTSFASVFILINMMTDMMEYFVKDHHYMLYYFSAGLYPKMLFMLDEKLDQVKINVRVGQALDTVAQVGKPRKITGFQTYTSPVVINNGERAEIGTEEYIQITNAVMENFVIIKKNPDYIDNTK